jgi:hypothetical protein
LAQETNRAKSRTRCSFFASIPAKTYAIQQVWRSVGEGERVMIKHRNENGELHRVDGPAIEWADGYRSWWVDGKRHRTDGPAYEGPNGRRAWWVDGKRHRTDGPAIEYENGTREWWLNGKRHRVDGPAVEWPDGTREWWLNGKFIKGERRAKEKE